LGDYESNNSSHSTFSYQDPVLNEERTRNTAANVNHNPGMAGWLKIKKGSEPVPGPEPVSLKRRI
jgi:hypothetical protein